MGGNYVIYFGRSKFPLATPMVLWQLHSRPIVLVLDNDC